MMIQTINPSTGEVLKDYVSLNENETNALIETSHTAFLEWRNTGFPERRHRMLHLASLLRLRIDDFALLMAQEMGKPIAQGRLEIKKCATLCEHFAEYAEIYLKQRIIKTEMSKAFVCYQPIGTVFAIMPWNFPFWQVFRFAVPTIMAGNTAIFKHAPISTGTGEAIEALFLKAGFPMHVFQHAILSNRMAANVIAHPHIAALSFTGSENAGRTLASLAGQRIKKCVLELGGNDPYLVFADADIDLAAQNIVASRLTNCGQVCIAAKRIIVIASVHDELVEKINALMSVYQMGDPMSPTTTLGPMARADLRETLHQQVMESVAKGARLLMGGNLPAGEGYYYPPTLLDDVNSGMPAFDTELFGPVIAVTSCKNIEEAIELANQSSYGLGAAIFTRNTELAEEIATSRLEAGVCFINAFVASDPRLPFGGIKNSGIGRELSREGILEFVNTKTIAIR